MPSLTSSREVSINRPILGPIKIVKGTIAAQVPMDDPTIHFVNGMTAMAKMKKGKERKALIIGFKP